MAQAGLEGDLQAECLNTWMRNSAADLALVAGLRGRILGKEESLQDTLAKSIFKEPGSTRIHLTRSAL